MPDRILGIDIDENSLRTVLVVRGMRSGYSVGLAEAIDFGEGGFSEALDRLREKVDFRQVRVNISLPAEKVSFHNVRLPFRDEKKIRQTIAFELEAMLPYGVEDCLLDFNVFRRGAESKIFAAVVARSAVKERLAILGENPPEIGRIVIGAMETASVLVAGKAFTGSGMLLDLGSRQTVAVFTDGEKIVQARRYDFGRLFPAASKEETDGSSSAQEKAEGAGKAAQEGIEDFREECRRFCRDLVNTIELLKWDGIMEDDISRVFVTGDGSRDAVIREELALSLSVPVEPADLADLCGIPLPEGIRDAWKPAVMNRALAIALSRHRKGLGFNFSLLQEESQVKREQFGRAAKWGAAVVTLSLLLLATDSYLDYRSDRLRLDNMKKEITALFKSSAPEVARVVDPVQQLKAKIGEAKKISAGLGGVAGGATVLDILRDISLLAPPETEFMILSFNLEENQLSIRGTAKDFDSVDSVKKELTKSKYLKSIQIGATSTTKQGDKVEFDMRMTSQR